ncbi:hypothetical protein F5887DRAFT_991784, partial [Amanita rubescens]
MVDTYNTYTQHLGPRLRQNGLARHCRSHLHRTVTHSTPTPSTLSPTSLSTLSPAISQTTSPPPSSSPALSQSTTPTPISPSSLHISPYLPLRQEQSLEPSQRQQYPVYSPTLVPAPSLPLTQLSASSFPSPVMNPSYGYTYGKPFTITSQTPPIMAMSMISLNSAVMYSPAMTPLPVSSPYPSPSASPTLSSASGLPLTSTPSMGQRRTRNKICLYIHLEWRLCRL